MDRSPEPLASAGKAFVAMDRTLDKAEIGPRWLLDEHVPQCVTDALRYGERALVERVRHIGMTYQEACPTKFALGKLLSLFMTQ